MSRPTVVIAGRPNVGKSSLVNRLCGRRVAVVEEERGVTRDRHVVTAEWGGASFDVVDTGGWLAHGDDLEQKVSAQADRAIHDADLVLLVTDVTTGVADEDREAARWLRRTGRPVVLVVNKVDEARREPEIWEFLSLGLGEPVAVSAVHGRGAGDLLDRIVRDLGESAMGHPADASPAEPIEETPTD